METLTVWADWADWADLNWGKLSIDRKIRSENEVSEGVVVVYLRGGESLSEYVFKGPEYVFDSLEWNQGILSLEKKLEDNRTLIRAVANIA